MQGFKEFLKEIPIPICGLILGAVSLGNLLFSKGFSILGNVYSLIGIALMFLFLMKIVFTMTHTLSALNDPIVASVAPTFTMAWMVICVFLNRLIPHSLVVHIIWLIAVLIHFVLMIYFVAVHIFPVKIELEHIYPSWFITFVGIGVIPNTSAAFNKELGQIIIWVALFFYLLLLPIIFKRVMNFEKMHESTLPLITIVTAPGSLCLAGYLAVAEKKSIVLIALLFVISQAIYFMTINFLRTMLKVQFYPSYAAFTFPLVISATAMNQIYRLFVNAGFTSVILKSLTEIELFLSVIIVSYVLVRYAVFLWSHLRSNVHVKKVIHDNQR